MPDEPNKERNPISTASMEAYIQKATVSMPTFYKVFSSLGSAASTLLLAIIGYTYNTVHDEWKSLKDDISEVRQALGQMPTPEEYERLRDKVELINERLIKLEVRLEE